MSRPENQDHLKIREFLGDSQQNFSAKKTKDAWQYRVVEKIAYHFNWGIEETMDRIRGHYKYSVVRKNESNKFKVRNTNKEIILMTITDEAKERICKRHSISEDKIIYVEKKSSKIHVYDGDIKVCCFRTRYISKADKMYSVK